MAPDPGPFFQKFLTPGPNSGPTEKPSILDPWPSLVSTHATMNPLLADASLCWAKQVFLQGKAVNQVDQIQVGVS